MGAGLGGRRWLKSGLGRGSTYQVVLSLEAGGFYSPNIGCYHRCMQNTEQSRKPMKA